MRRSSNSTAEGKGANVTEPPASSQRTDFLSKLLDRNGRWIEVADAKAGVVLAFATAALKELIAPQLADARTLLASLQRSGAWRQVWLPYVFLLFLVLTTILVLCAAYHAFKAINPTLTRRRPRGHIFFGDIAEQTDLATYQASRPPCAPPLLPPYRVLVGLLAPV